MLASYELTFLLVLKGIVLLFFTLKLNFKVIVSPYLFIRIVFYLNFKED